MKITFENVTKKFADKTVLDNFSLTLDLSGITIIMGESGCGKTTWLRLLAGLEKPDGGRITGVPEKISFMFQEDRLLNKSTALENISVVDTRGKADEYLERVFLGSEKNTPSIQLSGGMKRRVALARALCFDSSLVILDEPFKGLDEELKDKMISLVKQESENRPFIIVEHEREEAHTLSCNILEFSGIPFNLIKQHKM